MPIFLYFFGVKILDDIDLDGGNTKWEYNGTLFFFSIFSSFAALSNLSSADTRVRFVWCLNAAYLELEQLDGNGLGEARGPPRRLPCFIRLLPPP